jgi:hypothetical protein
MMIPTTTIPAVQQCPNKLFYMMRKILLLIVEVKTFVEFGFVNVFVDSAAFHNRLVQVVVTIYYKS